MTESEPRAGQEAARLFVAAQEWLRSSAPHLAPTGPDGTPCSCPLCRVVTAVREADPDSVAALVDGTVTQLAQLAAQLGDLAGPSGDAQPEANAGAADADDVPSAAASDPTSESATAGDPADDDASEPRAVRRLVIERDA